MTFTPLTSGEQGQGGRQMEVGRSGDRGQGWEAGRQRSQAGQWKAETGGPWWGSTHVYTGMHMDQG